MIEFLQDPAWTGVGAIATILAVTLYLVVERKKLFPKFGLRIKESKKSDNSTWWIIKFFLGFSVLFSISILLFAFIQTLPSEVFGLKIFFWIGRVFFYIALLVFLIPLGLIEWEWDWDFGITVVAKDWGNNILMLLAAYGPASIILYYSSFFAPSAYDALI
ncbi:MAG: hypothetical protein JXI43_14405 [Tissierellales bacterium]|nr:hypothetical protein [Tissierellales bacterium]